MKHLLHFFIAFSGFGFSSYCFAQTVVQLTPSSVSPWVVPCGVSGISIQLVGAGGAGGDGGQSGGANPIGGGGGGGGEILNVINIPVVPGQVFTFSVGLGGINGGTVNGGTTTFNGLVYVANGGQGGTNVATPAPGVGGAGGTGSTGNDGFFGANGVFGAAPAGSGGSGGNNGLGSGGAGQTSIVGPGLSGGIGGGGAGGFGNNQDGGNGGNGIITITMSAPSEGSTTHSLATCGTVATMNADVVGAPYTGMWTNLTPSVPEVINTPLSPTSTISNLVPGTTYTVDWAISGVGCPTLTQEVTIITTLPTVDAGNDIQLCSASLPLSGNVPEPGLTGTWTCVGCAGAVVTMVDPNDPFTVINGLNAGETVTFTWTITDGTAGCTVSDAVVVNFPSVCNDGPCGATLLTLAAGCPGVAGSINTATATPSTGMDEPGCGGYASTDDDVWYSFVIPAGQGGDLTIRVDGVSAVNDYMNYAIYTGPCDDLDLAVCQALGYPGTGGAINASVHQFTEGETIYIRIWDYQNDNSSFNVCVANFLNVSEIVPGMNTISCGETFYDPGSWSAANDLVYNHNQLNVYQICPPDGQFASVNFANWALGAGDQVTILDGAATNAPIIGSFTGSSLAGATYTASGLYGDSCLTVIFMSNYVTNGFGWEATANCSLTPGTNTVTCGPEDCLGGCVPTICAIPGTATFIGDGVGASNELNENNNGCFQAGFEGEQCTNWFLINPETPGTLTCDIYVNPGQDHDFLVYEAYAPALGCPSLTSNQPIRCNATSGGNAMGTGWNSAVAPYNYTTDPYYEPEIVITQAQIDAGIYFLINLKNYNNGCSNPEVDITFGGTATVTCEAPNILPIELVEFSGNTDGKYNTVTWKTLTELNNDYFTLLGSPDGSNWQQLGIIRGAGTTYEPKTYEFEDDILSLQMTYYKLKQTDYDGESKVSHTIALARDFDFTTVFSHFFPNPSTNTFYFNYGGDYFNQPIHVAMYNSTGQVVLTQTFESFNNQVSMSVNCDQLATGIYHVVLSQGDVTEYQRVSLMK